MFVAIDSEEATVIPACPASRPAGKDRSDDEGRPATQKESVSRQPASNSGADQRTYEERARAPDPRPGSQRRELPTNPWTGEKSAVVRPLLCFGKSPAKESHRDRCASVMRITYRFAGHRIMVRCGSILTSTS